jgi:hypothetical protein
MGGSYSVQYPGIMGRIAVLKFIKVNFAMFLERFRLPAAPKQARPEIGKRFPANQLVKRRETPPILLLMANRQNEGLPRTRLDIDAFRIQSDSAKLYHKALSNTNTSNSNCGDLSLRSYSSLRT